jgi:hypothetical protein
MGTSSANWSLTSSPTWREEGFATVHNPSGTRGGVSQVTEPNVVLRRHRALIAHEHRPGAGPSEVPARRAVAVLVGEVIPPLRVDRVA